MRFRAYYLGLVCLLFWLFVVGSLSGCSTGVSSSALNTASSTEAACTSCGLPRAAD